MIFEGYAYIIQLRVMDLPETAPGAVLDMSYVSSPDQPISQDDLLTEMEYASVMGCKAFLRQAIPYSNTVQ